MFKEDTIAAITTGMSNAGVGIIRISGDRACEITDMLFRAANKNKKAVNMKSYTAAFGGVYEDDRMIDEAILLVMKAPAPTSMFSRMVRLGMRLYIWKM